MFNSHYFHSDFGFHVYIDEMNLDSGDDATNVDWKCRDYLQFGRDVFLLTTFRSQDYCGIRTRIQVTRSRRVVSSNLLKILSNVHTRRPLELYLYEMKIKNQISKKLPIEIIVKRWFQKCCYVSILKCYFKKAIPLFNIIFVFASI